MNAINEITNLSGSSTGK